MAFPTKTPRPLWIAWALNLHIGLIAVGFLLSAGRWANLAVSPALITLVFFAGLLVYGADRTGAGSPEDALNQPERYRWHQVHRKGFRGMLAFSFVFVAVCWWLVPADTRAASALYAILAVGYTRPLLPGRRRLQDFPRLKFLCAVGGWACIPFLISGFGSGGPAWLWTMYRAGWLGVNFAWSEWRDAEGDVAAGRKNLFAGKSPGWMRRLGRGFLAGTLVMGFWTGAGVDLFGPLVFWAAQETFGKKRPRLFAELADLPLLFTLVT